MYACAFLSGAAVNFAPFSASYANIRKVVDDLSPIAKEYKQDKATNCIHNMLPSLVNSQLDLSFVSPTLFLNKVIHFYSGVCY